MFPRFDISHTIELFEFTKIYNLDERILSNDEDCTLNDYRLFMVNCKLCFPQYKSSLIA